MYPAIRGACLTALLVASAHATAQSDVTGRWSCVANGKEIDIRSPLPEDLRRALAAMTKDSLPDVDFGDLDPLEYFGFYQLHL